MTERTLAIIKPDAVERHLTGAILQRIEAQGFQIRAMRLVHLSKKQAEGFYAVHRDRSFFASLTDFMSSGPAVILVLEATDAIRRWRLRLLFILSILAQPRCSDCSIFCEAM